MVDESQLWQDYIREWGMLDQQYVSGQWRTRQEEVIRYIQPYRGRFDLGQENQQPRKDQSIVNDTASDASKKLSAAAQMGISSGARKWTAFTSTIPELRDDPACKRWFDEARDVVLQLFAESNFYKALASVYDDLVCPATSLMFIEEDERDIIRGVHYPVGMYRLAVDARRRVSRTFVRFSMTVEQVVDKFCRVEGQSGPDLSKLSRSVQALWHDKKYYAFVPILHITEQRRDRQFGKIDGRNKPWASRFLEWCGTPSVNGGQTDQVQGFPRVLLSDGGWDEQPFIAPRYDVTGEDAYGCDSPGFLTIGDVKGLQALENSGASILALLQKPPMNVPPQLASGSMVPGAKNNIEDPRVKFEPSYVPRPEAVTVGSNEKRQYEQRVIRGHHGDLLFLISSDPRTQPATAEEIRAKQQERLLALGGFFSRFSDEALTPALNRTLAIAQRRGLVPPPPPKLLRAAMKGGRVLKAEFLNSIAEAQKAQGVAPILGWVNDAVTIAKELGRSDVTDKIDFDQFMETTADMRGVPAKLVVPDEVVAQKRQARAQAAADQANTEQAVQQAKAYKDLSQSDPEQVAQTFRQFSPAAEAQGTGNGL
jgi:hypothetical protein